MIMISALSQAQSSKKRYLKPKGDVKKVPMVISEKNRTYYKLSSESESSIYVKGPGQLRVISRGKFSTSNGNKLRYDVLYSINGGKQEKESMSVLYPSKTAKYANGEIGLPGQSRDFEIELDRGYHNIDFLLGNSSNSVAARYMFTPTKPKKKTWISYSPLQPAEQVDLVTKEEVVGYYRFSKEKPLKVQVIGPTQLRFFSRIENHYHMKGKIQYRIQVKEKGDVLNTYQLSSSRSEITFYKDNKELVPGKGREFVINVPKGKHTYEIVPLDKDKSTILGRFLLPKSDVNIRN